MTTPEDSAAASADIERPLSWRIRHSAWILAVLLGFGSFSCIGFIYCAIRMQTRKWWGLAGVTTALSLVALVLLLVQPDESASNFAAGYAALLWFALIGLALWVNRDYLDWRSRQESTRAPLGKPTATSPIPHEVPAAPPLPAPARPLSAASIITDAIPPRDSKPTDVDSTPANVSEQLMADPVKADTDTDSAIFIGTWQEAEVLTAAHMRQLGFAEVRLSASGADGGIDATATGAVAQVKHYAAPVGAPLVQQLRGAAHGQDWALFYALSGYTAKAVEYADASQVALFTYTTEGVVDPVNGAARFLTRRAGQPFDPSVLAEEATMALGLQQIFDASIELLMSKCNEGLELSQRVADGAQLRAALQTETTRLMALLEGLPDTMPSSRISELISEVLAATVRVISDIERFGSRRSSR